MMNFIFVNFILQTFIVQYVTWVEIQQFMHGSDSCHFLHTKDLVSRFIILSSENQTNFFGNLTNYFELTLKPDMMTYWKAWFEGDDHSDFNSLFISKTEKASELAPNWMDSVKTYDGWFWKAMLKQTFLYVEVLEVWRSQQLQCEIFCINCAAYSKMTNNITYRSITWI